MKIESNIKTNKFDKSSKKQLTNDVNSKKFSEEMSEIASKKDTKEVKESQKNVESKNNKAENDAKSDKVEATTQAITNDVNIKDDNIENVKNGLVNIANEINSLTHKDDKSSLELKPFDVLSDNDVNKNEENSLINNNDINIKDQQEALLLQMDGGMNMNFNSDNKPFPDFLQEKNDNKLNSTAKELAEEQKILSTMEENIALANKNTMLKTKTQNLEELNTQKEKHSVKTVQSEKGIRKVDKKSDITLETVVKYENVVMDKSDVEFFAKLVTQGQAESNLKSIKVSKTLADLLNKAMNDNKPVRIDFDNNISVIIKISRDGKISADFLPSSQVAEAYLKENIPLLRQRFENQNIDYGELNQRQRRQDDRDNKKKGRKDE